MGQDYEVRDLRFDGYDNEALALQVDGLRSGPGPASLHHAMGVLVKIALGLKQTDDTLREQLADIGVTWQGQAADGGTSATENARVYAEDAVDPTIDSAQGVGSSGEAFSTTKNSAPDAGTLRGPTELNGVDQFAGFFGHTTDHAQEVKATNAARQQTIDSMNGYQSSSSKAISQSQALPVPPGMNLVAQPVDTSTHISSVSVATPTGGLNPTGGPNAGAGTSFAPGGGGGTVNPIPTTGPNPPVTGAPPLTGGGPLPNTNLFPTTATNPLTPALRAANPMLMADAATAMGAGGASGAGAGAERDRLARNAGARGAMKNATPLGAAPEEEARAARNAERFGARTGGTGKSIMQPAAAGGRKAEGEEDGEHVRRYGVESSDVFDDDRVVAPESIGDDDE